MVIFAQLAALTLVTAGLGWICWRLIGRPAPGRGQTWFWCGLGGLAGGLLLLQALAYCDLPLRRTAPLLFGVACAGVIGLGFGLRRWRAGSVPRFRREVAWVLSAGAVAMAGHSVSMVGIGRDRFLGHHEYDLVNYVTTAEFLAGERFSTEREDMGLRPWLWRPVDLKTDRITECVAIGLTAALTGTDAQGAWGSTAVFFTGLLAMALAGLWRVCASLSPARAALLGIAGALAPVVAYVFLVGFFSQLTSLFVLPALIAVCRPGALPRRAALTLVVLLLGFLAGTYTEFWAVGCGVAAAALLVWRLGWVRWAGLVAALAAGSALLTSAYAARIPTTVFARFHTVGPLPHALAGFVPGGIGWSGVGGQYFNAGPRAAALAGFLVAAGAVLGVLLQPRHRRLNWACALLVPAGMLATLYLAPVRWTYGTFKALVEISPVVIGLSAVGWGRLAGRAGARFVMPAEAALGAVILLIVVGTERTHLALVRVTHGEQSGYWERLWGARDRAGTAAGQTLLITADDRLTGAWLAYFARKSEAYYDLFALSDRRMPSESAVCRKIPAGRTLSWFSLDREGPVTQREPSPIVKVEGANHVYGGASHRIYGMRGRLTVRIERTAGYPPPEKPYYLDAGLTLLPGAGAEEVAVRQDERVVATLPLNPRTVVHLPLRLRAGANTISFVVREPPNAAAPSQGREEGDQLLLEALSLEESETPEPARDHGPAAGGR